MNYLLVFYVNNELHYRTLKSGENLTVGSGAENTINFSNCGLSEKHLMLRSVDSGVNILSNNLTFLN